MLSKSRLDFILQITNSIHGHYEPDASGPGGPIDQILTGLVIQAWATNIEDVEARGQMLAAADKVIAKNAQSAAKSL